MKGPKKLSIDAINSDLAAVEQMIQRARAFNDAIGEFQFNRRKQSLQDQLREIGEADDRTGRIAVFFGGGPVLGSHGVEADFAGEALHIFQELVQKRMAVEEFGAVASRGPVARRSAAQLLITDVARGSFGFVLEEAAASDALTDTELKVILEKTGNLISSIASEESAIFEEAIDGIDSRSLISLKKFFDTIDNGHATLRIVEGDRDFTLQRPDVSRARYRVDSTEIDDDEVQQVTGTLYFLPQHKKFELLSEENNQTIYGTVEAPVIRRLMLESPNNSPSVGRRWRAVLKVKRVRQRGREEKIYYRLTDLSEPVADLPP